MTRGKNNDDESLSLLRMPSESIEDIVQNIEIEIGEDDSTWYAMLGLFIIDYEWDLNSILCILYITFACYASFYLQMTLIFGLVHNIASYRGVCPSKYLYLKDACSIVFCIQALNSIQSVAQLWIAVYYHEKMSPFKKLSALVFVLLPQTFAELCILFFGCQTISSSNEERIPVILDTTACFFILEIDEAVASWFLPVITKRVLNQLEPVDTRIIIPPGFILVVPFFKALLVCVVFY
jgi:hypothetical protein